MFYNARSLSLFALAAGFGCDDVIAEFFECSGGVCRRISDHRGHLGRPPDLAGIGKGSSAYPECRSEDAFGG